MTEQDARRKVLDWANAALAPTGLDAAILDAATLRKPYGWVFFYQSRSYVETGNASDQVAGNGPVVVTRSDGALHPLGTALPPDQEIASFERRRGLGR